MKTLAKNNKTDVKEDKKMNKELLEALEDIEKEKKISRDILLEAIENSLISAYKSHFGKAENGKEKGKGKIENIKAENVKVSIDPETCEFHVYQVKKVVDIVEEDTTEISIENAREINSMYEIGDVVNIEVESQEFSRIATQNARGVIVQKIREEERKILFEEYREKQKKVETGTVENIKERKITVKFGNVDAILSENEQVKTESFRRGERIKVYVLEVKDPSQTSKDDKNASLNGKEDKTKTSKDDKMKNFKGLRILVSRTHPELVRGLFEAEVSEIRDGIVEIKSISREAGSRTKIAVYSNDINVDPVGACVGLNGARVNAIVKELRGEKIDIINWDEKPAKLIENALSPAKVIFVSADADAKKAKVVVPDDQLSLAIGKEGQNARIAARLTGFKIDIKSETQAKEDGDFDGFGNDDKDQIEEYEE